MTQGNHEHKTVPPFRRVADYLRRKIRLGEYRSGQMLPTMEEIAVKFKLHRHTVETGIKLLQNENLLTSRPGGGTVVNETLPEQHKSAALLLPDTGSEHWRRTAQEIENKLKCSNWHLDVHEHFGNARKFRKQIRRLAAGKYAGALVAAAPELLNSYAPLGSLIKSSFPVTFIGNGPAGIPCWSVDDGDFTGGYLGTLHLLERRFKHIALVGCESHNGEIFVNGCRQAFREYGIEPAAIDFADDEKRAVKLLQSWLVNIDAVFYQQSEHAQKAFYFLQSKRIQIGRQIGFITFDDTLFRRLTIPSPTVIRRYPERLGKRAAKALLEQIAMPRELRNYDRRINAEVTLEAGRSTGERAGKKILYQAKDPVGNWRERNDYEEYDFYHRLY